MSPKAQSLSSSVPCPSVGWSPPPLAFWARDGDTGSVSKEDQVGQRSADGMWVHQK